MWVSGCCVSGHYDVHVVTLLLPGTCTAAAAVPTLLRGVRGLKGCLRIAPLLLQISRVPATRGSMYQLRRRTISSHHPPADCCCVPYVAFSLCGLLPGARVIRLYGSLVVNAAGCFMRQRSCIFPDVLLALAWPFCWAFVQSQL